MKYTLYGKTGLKVSELCLGTMTFGDTGNLGENWGISKEVAKQIFDRYLEVGGNFIDSANIYTHGKSEEFVGEFARNIRETLVISTKYNSETNSNDVNSVGSHRKNLVQSLEASLRRLSTDYIDIYWVHARDTFTPIEETMRALDDQVRAGKILYVGVSDWPAWEIARANTLAEWRDWSAFIGLQIRYNLLARTPERELLPLARAFDLGVTVWGPLAEGILTGKYLNGETGRRDKFNVKAEEQLYENAIVAEVVAIAEEIECSPAQVALAWLLYQPAVIIPIIGATKLAQFEDNLNALNVTLSDDVLARLDVVSATSLGFPHEFLRNEIVTNIVYGHQRDKIIDKRFTVRRTINDVLTNYT